VVDSPPTDRSGLSLFGGSRAVTLHDVVEVAEVVRPHERLREIGFGDDDAAALLRLG
jgi:hypothetical protein